MKQPRGAGMVPAAARAPSKEAREEQYLSASAVAVFEKTLGGRQRLTEILSIGAAEPEVEKVLNLLLDPTQDDVPLPKLCSLARLSVADLFKAFQKAALVRAHVQSVNLIEQHLPAIIADLLKRAQPHTEECNLCQGTGYLPPAEPTRKQPNPSPIPCKACYGRGSRTVIPDLDRQQVVLELAELLKKGGGLSISQQTLVATPPSASNGGSFELLQQAVSEALYSRSDRVSAVEGTVLPPERSHNADDPQPKDQ